MKDIVRSRHTPVTKHLMSTSNAPVPPVALSEPSPKSLCGPLFFALMLSSLRLRFPRVHYTFPNFATFCRGESLRGEALALLQGELEEILLGMQTLTGADIFLLASGEDPEDPEIYRQAHYRGRTFDRTRVRRADEESVENPGSVYGDLLRTIQREAKKAFIGQEALSQVRRSYHRPLGPTGFDGD